jgi:hypothetical protein
MWPNVLLSPRAPVRACSVLETAKDDGLANDLTGTAGRTRWKGWVMRTATEVAHLVALISTTVAVPAPRG